MPSRWLTTGTALPIFFGSLKGIRVIAFVISSSLLAVLKTYKILVLQCYRTAVMGINRLLISSAINQLSMIDLLTIYNQ
jgi:hypothetical protein